MPLIEFTFIQSSPLAKAVMIYHYKNPDDDIFIIGRLVVGKDRINKTEEVYNAQTYEKICKQSQKLKNINPVVTVITMDSLPQIDDVSIIQQINDTSGIHNASQIDDDQNNNIYKYISYQINQIFIGVLESLKKNFNKNYI